MPQDYKSSGAGTVEFFSRDALVELVFIFFGVQSQ